MKNTNFRSGFALVETVIASAIVASFIITLSLVNSRYLGYALDHSDSMKASFLLEESLEAVRFMRDDSWSGNIETLTTGNNFYLYWDGSSWEGTTTLALSDGMYRQIMLQDVYRDAEQSIAPSGTLDPDTKFVTATVSWASKTGTSTKVLKSYITNVFDN